MIILDTSVLVAELDDEGQIGLKLQEALLEGCYLAIPSPVLYEWSRGPRTQSEVREFGRLFPVDRLIPFGPREALVAARLYRTLSRPRGREMDFAIAACALVRDAELWTLNRDDFTDLPQLRPSAR